MSKQPSTKLLWFGNTGDKSSFSRLAHSVIPILVKDYEYEITVISPQHGKKTDLKDIGVEIYTLGEPIIDEKGTQLMEWEEFSYGFGIGPRTQQHDRLIECKMKYTLLQAIQLIKNKNIDIFFICMGIYESNWFAARIKDLKNTKAKFATWVPIDYIPSRNVVKDLLNLDILITMTPMMELVLKKFGGTNKAHISWACHGLGKEFYRIPHPRRRQIKDMNRLKGQIWNSTLSKLKEDDIILLNANNYAPRKRFDLTLEAFIKLIYTYEKPKSRILLWIHSSITKSEELTNLIHRRIKEFPKLAHRLIHSNNNVDGKYLNMIYNIAQIGIQTSTGEGWSLTNCEHAWVGGRQVVPNWLATGYHFRKRGGYMVPFSIENEVNEAGHRITVGVVKVDELIEEIKKAISELEMKMDPELYEHLCECTWEKAAEQIHTALI